MCVHMHITYSETFILRAFVWTCTLLSLCLSHHWAFEVKKAVNYPDENPCLLCAIAIVGTALAISTNVCFASCSLLEFAVLCHHWRVIGCLCTPLWANAQCV